MNKNPSPFPANFAWGISSSSYQTEEPGAEPGEPAYFQTDWDLFFQQGGVKYPKMNGTFSFSEFERDIAALVSLGVSHYRFSIEWARVEPEPGKFNPEAIEYYVHLVKRLRQENIVPVVALWHFSFPSWLGNLKKPAEHGWLHPKIRIYWPLFVKKMVESFGAGVSFYAPQNEPNTHAMASYLAKMFPPGVKMNPYLYYKSMKRAADCFQTAAWIVRKLQPQAKILSAQNLVYWKKSPLDPVKVFFSFCKDFNFYHLDRVIQWVDIVGVTYYMGESASPWSLLTQQQRIGPHTSDLGWPICPEGLTELMSYIWKRYQKPIMLLENGIADRQDQKRPDYIVLHTKALKEALDLGCDIQGYFHWSLVDNYEWAFGYGPKFGLFSLDDQSKKIIPKESARIFREQIKHYRNGEGSPTSSNAGA